MSIHIHHHPAIIVLHRNNESTPLDVSRVDFAVFSIMIREDSIYRTMVFLPFMI